MQNQKIPITAVGILKHVCYNGFVRKINENLRYLSIFLLVKIITKCYSIYS